MEDRNFVGRTAEAGGLPAVPRKTDPGVRCLVK